MKDRVQYYISTPVTVNVRVAMNESLRFPVLTLCNKNAFSVSRMRHLRGVMIAEQVSDGRASRLHHPTLGWNVSQLVGYREMDVRQVWQSIAHDPNDMIAEVHLRSPVGHAHLMQRDRLSTHSLNVMMLLVLVRTQCNMQPSRTLGARFHVHGRVSLVRTQ